MVISHFASASGDDMSPRLAIRALLLDSSKGLPSPRLEMTDPITFEYSLQTITLALGNRY